MTCLIEGMMLHHVSDILAVPVAGMVVGYGVDRFFHVAPWGLVIGLVVGSCVGFYRAFKILGK